MMERLWEVPPTWEWSVVGELGNVVSGGTPSTKITEYWGGDVIWFAPSDLTGYKQKFIARGARTLTEKGLAESSAKLIPAGSVMYSSRAPVGYVAINSEPSATNQGFKSVIPHRELFNEYIYHYLKATKHIAEERATGTTFKELSGSAFSVLPVPVPPINEQRRIVEKIEALFTEIDQGVESLRAAKKLIALYRQSLLKAAFEGHLTADWRARNADDPGSPELIGMTNLPAGWAKVSLEELITPDGIFTDGDWVESKDQDPNGEIRLIQLADIADSRFVDKSSRFLTRGKAKELNCTFLKKGDLMVARMPDPLGRCCIFPLEEDNRFVTVVDVCIIRLGSAEIDPQYLMRAINSPIVRAEIATLQSGSTRKRISRKNLATITIPIAPPNEQHEIVRILDTRLEAVGALDQEIDVAFTRAEGLRQSILKKAFSGKLVPQDPNDKPALDLLARIKAERAESSARRRKKRAVAEA